MNHLNYISAAFFLSLLFFTDEQLKGLTLLGSILLGVRYLHWRGFHTLNTEDPFSVSVSLIVYLAEAYGFLAMLLFYIQAAKPIDRSATFPKKEGLPSVDIYVTIYNESLDILYKTLVATVAIDYPPQRKQVYVLDDGHRSEVKQMAERLGCCYLGRPTHEHAKAGNLNYGLKHSSGQFVVVLDCDHVPIRTFLNETIGFFEDPKVAFVQTPHFFYNPDTFQRNLRLEREIANEQDLFFYVIQPGRDRYNASFFAGSGGVFRRSSLEEIGGFQVETLTEDLHTSMVLHAKGHRSIYLNKILAVGLAPESYRSYLRQRQRWTRGAIQVFLMDNPLLKRGLTFMQRLNYFGSLFYFFHGWARLVYLSAPLSFLLLNTPPLLARLSLLLYYYVPYYMVSFIAFNLISKKYRNPFWSDVYETVMSFSISRTAVWTLLRPEKMAFHVTPKGERFDKVHLEWSYVFPHMLLSILLLAGLGIGMDQLWHHTANRDAALVSIFWTAYNLVILATAIVVAREQLQKRASYRLRREIPCELSFEGKIFSGRTSDLGETGLSLILDQTLLLPPQVKVRLFSNFGETTEMDGEVTRNDFLPSGLSSIGIRFLNVNEKQHQSLIHQIYSSPTSWEKTYQASSTWRSFFHLITSSLRAFVREKILRRGTPRLVRELSCELAAEGFILRGKTLDISQTGCSIYLENDEIRCDQVTVRLFKGDQEVCIRGEMIRCTKTIKKGIVVGIRFLERKDLELSSLLSNQTKEEGPLSRES